MVEFKPFTAYIVDACRTAGGKKNGKLSGYHPGELGAAVCDALLERQKLPGAEVEDVIFGCVGQVGAQAANVGRTVVLSSRLLPESVPGTSVDRQCGSSQQADGWGERSEKHRKASKSMRRTACICSGAVGVQLMDDVFHMRGETFA
ncbi:unnamed protein product [Durusdinium trenchii]|uniref:Thiolase N-terminal domain-containing protein n=1 Tax=Durusdinium trenchii TaxID=1381693 RepID=A0ABP0N459_9DINO